jgi:hypothetical protein
VKVSHYFVIALLVIGLLYVYHNFIQSPGGVKQGLKGLGINR